VILIPAYPAEPAQLAQQTIWLKNLFGNRGWMGLHLPLQQADDYQQQHVQHIAQENGLRVVAVGHVLMHVRSRNPAGHLKRYPPQPAIAGMRPLAATECRTASALTFSAGRIYSADALAETLILQKAAISVWTACAMNIRMNWYQPDSRPKPICAAKSCRCASALPARDQRASDSPHRIRTGAD
jgi:hypothetical protein